MKKPEPIRIKSAYEQIARLELEIPSDPTAAILHVRAMGMRLGELATIAAEEKWPGFEALLGRLIDKEVELESKARLA